MTTELHPFLTEQHLERAVACTSEVTGIDPEAIRILADERMKTIKSDFAKNGIVIVRNAITMSKTREAVQDIWTHILSLPFVPRIKEEWQDIHNSMKDDYWRDVTKKESDRVKACYPMTGGFGALTRSPAFHLKTQWDVRQDPYIASIFSNILGTPELMVTLDRISFKYPGQGEGEFEHWDSNPFHWDQEEYEGVQGILALSETSFFAVPGTNTESFRKKFVEHYSHTVPGISEEQKTHRKSKEANKNEYRIDKNDDPLGLYNKAEQYKLYPGDLVIWSARCLHQARKNTTKKVRYAYFISYHPRGKPQPAALEGYQKKGISYLEDRLHSYETGKNPIFFPSGIEIRLYSRMAYMMHPANLNKFTAMFTEGTEEREYGPDTKKAGQKVNVPVEWSPLDSGFYTPPKLTKLGRYLLGASDTYI